MRASTFRPMASRTALPLLALCFAGMAALGCGTSREPLPGDPPGPEPLPGPAPQCEADAVGPGATFERTAGPDLARFVFVAATKDVVFASTGTSLHRSLDEGKTWSLVDAEPLRGAYIVALGAFGDDVFVSIGGTDGESFVRSSDRGVTWTSAASGDVTMPSYLTSDGTSLFAANFGRVYQWRPSDASWQPLPQGDQFFDVIESDGSYVYGDSMYTPGVYRVSLNDEAAAWTPVVDLPQWGYRAFAFQNGHGYAANATQIFQSVDGGASWQATPRTYVQVDDMLAVGGRVFISTGAGLYTTGDGSTWDKLDDRSSGSAFALAATSSHVFTASGTLERATTSDTAPNAWEALHPFGDAVGGVYATTNAVLSTSGGHLLRTVDGGASWSEVLIDGEAAGLSSVVVRKSAPSDVVFALRPSPVDGHVAILASTDDGATFEERGSAPSGANWVNFLADTGSGLVLGVTTGAGNYCQDVQDTTTELYVSGDDGATFSPAMNGFPITFTDCYDEEYTPGITGVTDADGVLFATTFWLGTYRSDDRGATWAAIETPESIGTISSITAIDDTIFGVASGGGIVRSADGGLTWKLAGLEGLPVASLVLSGETLFASVPSASSEQAGVYASEDSGQTWTRVDAGFDARVGSVAVQGGFVYAATLDESVWSAPLSCSAD